MIKILIYIVSISSLILDFILLFALFFIQTNKNFDGDIHEAKFNPWLFFFQVGTYIFVLMEIADIAEQQYNINKKC